MTNCNRDDEDTVHTEREALQSLVHDTHTASDPRPAALASANLVNRTHRVVQERARTIADRRSKIRSLWAPFLIFSSLLLGICAAIWTVLDEYDLVASGTQVASYQVLVPLFWSIPVSAALLAVVWFGQTRGAGRRPVE